MKKHTRIYLKHFGFGMDDFIPCELCGSRAVDIHHISPRGMGGSKQKDEIENLMALCRVHHDEAEGEILSEKYLRSKHLSYMEANDEDQKR